MGPTGERDSPYEPLSSFAISELLISPDGLIDDGLLQPTDCAAPAFREGRVDYDAAGLFKNRLIERAWDNFRQRANPELRRAFDQFRNEQAHWLDDYALFRALKHAHAGVGYRRWPHELVCRNPAALAEAQRKLANAMACYRFAQFLAFRQAGQITEYAGARGVRLIGDVPFFVSLESADVWAHPELFLLDAEFAPRFVAGVPPDYFSAEGQLWGNPVYDWKELDRTGYAWWIDRFRALLLRAGIVRLDHFRALVAAWHVPTGAANAKTGTWSPGPGPDFLVAVEGALGALPFIAEDLGHITADVVALRDQFHLPGMRVMQFAFDGKPENPFLPQNFIENTVAYTGTHDNDTTRGWYESLPEDERDQVWKSLRCAPVEISQVADRFLQLAWESKAALAIAPLQDVLNLGTATRINVPGRPLGNWQWRCIETMMDAPESFHKLLDLTEKAGRLPTRR